MMKRTLSFLLVLSMLLTMLVACSGGSDKNDGKNPTTTAPSDTPASSDAITAEIEPMDEALANLDYGGDRTVVILARDDKEGWAADELYVEELSSDPVSDSIYNRNATVCEILGLEDIILETTNGREGIQQKVNVMVGSDDQTYDIVAASVVYGTPMIRQGLVYNLYDNGIDTYLDATKPWWSQYWIEQAELGGRLYCITGAPALSLSRLLFVTYYNKDLADRIQLEEDMYTVVDEGRWTLDYISELIPEMYSSLNGDDIRDEEDMYGLAINHYEHVDMFFNCLDLTMLSKDEEGWLEPDNTSKEKISTAFDKVFALIRENTGTFDTEDTEGFDVAMGMFAGGNVLFAPLHLKYAETASFRNMQDEYGILPIPKYDEKQENYYTYAHDQYTVFMVPKTVADPELSGAVLEAMAYESYKSVQPTYYNLVLKGRYANDPQSRKMLDTITTGVRVDPGFIYSIMLGEPNVDVFRSPIYHNERSFATEYAKESKMLPIFTKGLKEEISQLDF